MVLVRLCGVEYAVCVGMNHLAGGERRGWSRGSAVILSDMGLTCWGD